MYGPGLYTLGWGRGPIYHGVWGRGLFQSVYQRRPGLFESLPSMPEWYLLLAVLGLVGSLGAFWRPLLLAWAGLGLAGALSLLQAAIGSSRALAARRDHPHSRRRRLARLGLTTLLFLLQPAARLVGRIENGLTPWRLRAGLRLTWPRPRTMAAWCERWRPHEERVAAVEGAISELGVLVRRGGDFDRWDLEVPGGLFGGVRVLCAVEEHGQGKQLLRIRIWPRWSALAPALVLVLAVLSVGAAREEAWLASAGLGLGAALVAWRVLRECATGAVLRATDRAREEWT
jgi:hypothetical protein